MANPIFEALGGTVAQQNGSANISSMFQNFMRNFVGDPTQILQQRINNGEISQQQYNQLRGIAENIVNTLPH